MRTRTTTLAATLAMAAALTWTATASTANRTHDGGTTVRAEGGEYDIKDVPD
ncbi:hypothetical protein ACIBI9_20900 [Nonomuraea sp. NPDC050451]|uniref:hypothetical protein n=1 Tax=Nonomuraea sp. NPDC050451 TaxID=3364364 RepID=UPI00379CBCBE